MPTARIRPPAFRVSVTIRAVDSGTLNNSVCGAPPASCEDTPVCRAIGATATPAVTSRVTSSAVKGLPAEGISVLIADRGRKCPPQGICSIGSAVLRARAGHLGHPHVRQSAALRTNRVAQTRLHLGRPQRRTYAGRGARARPAWLRVADVTFGGGSSSGGGRLHRWTVPGTCPGLHPFSRRERPHAERRTGRGSSIRAARRLPRRAAPQFLLGSRYGRSSARCRWGGRRWPG